MTTGCRTTDSDTPTERFRRAAEDAGFTIKGELRADMTQAHVIALAENLLEQIQARA